MASLTKLTSIIEPDSPESRDFVERTARCVSRFGLENERCFLAEHNGSGQFNFLRSSDLIHPFYQLKLTGYLGENYFAQPPDLFGPPLFMDLMKRYLLEHLDFPSPDLPPSPRNLSFTIPGGITPKETCIIKLTAQFMVRHGVQFGGLLMESKEPRFDFMKDSRVDFLNGLIDAYAKVLKTVPLPKSKSCAPTALECFFQRLQLEKLEEGDKMALIYVQALVSGVDCFAYMADSNYSAIMPPPGHLSVLLGSQPTCEQRLGGALEHPSLWDLLRCPGNLPFTFPGGITLQELCIMKLTAQFMVRYGMRFWRGLGKRVVANPLFDFMKPGGRGNHMFTLIVAAYEKVLELSFMSRRSDAWVLERFFDYLQLDKLEVGDKMAIIDLHAFVSGVDCFALMEDARYSAMMISPPTQPEEPPGQKFDEATTLVPNLCL